MMYCQTDVECDVCRSVSTCAATTGAASSGRITALWCSSASGSSLGLTTWTTCCPSLVTGTPCPSIQSCPALTLVRLLLVSFTLATVYTTVKSSCAFTHLATHSYTHSLIHSSIQSFIHSFIHACILSFSLSLVCSFVRLFSHSFIHSFIHSFVYLFQFICFPLELSNQQPPSLLVWSRSDLKKACL